MKSNYGGPQQTKRKKNKQSEQSKSGTKKCAPSEFIPLTKEATMSAVTISEITQMIIELLSLITPWIRFKVCQTFKWHWPHL